MEGTPRGLVLFFFVVTGVLACIPPPPPAPEPPALRATFEDGQPIEGVTVLVNGEATGQTDAQGQLPLDLPPGRYTIGLHLTQADGGFARTERSLEWGGDMPEVVLTLPRPLAWRAPLEVTTGKVHLAWEPLGANGLREYRIHAQERRDPFVGTEEPRGPLVFVGREASRTELEVTGGTPGPLTPVTAGMDFYFRVFVHHEDGAVSGSRVLAVKTPRWDNASQLTRRYDLGVESRFTMGSALHGIAYDGAALWLLSWTELGGYYVEDQITLRRIDPDTRQVLQTVSFKDTQLPSGLTWDGEALWVGFENKLVRIHPSTGERERSFMSEPTRSSLSWLGGHFVRNDWGLRLFEPERGTLARIFRNPFSGFGTFGAAGIAARPGELWLSDRFVEGLAIVDEDGRHVGVVDAASHFDHMVFMGDRLVAVTPAHEVVIMKVLPR